LDVFLKLLAIDTATEQCSVALLQDTECIDKCVPTPRGHTELILPMIQQLLSESGVTLTQLDAIAFGRGPGAFTGVRIAIGVAQGLGFALGIPLVPVSNLAAVAQQATDRLAVGERVAVCMDARMNEIYSGLFAKGAEGLVVPVADEKVLAPEQLHFDHTRPKIGLGTGFRAYPVLRETCVGMLIEEGALPRAREIVQLAAHEYVAGRGVAPDQAAPVYLRNQVVHVKAS
jgi:tRNA threonylcarbamoyladenosine biosynthesis protein TsaB